ncbi:MAG: hypothetical protein ACJATF_001863 [Flavobacteriales bacterium]|jgi:hypothetical protein
MWYSTLYEIIAPIEMLTLHIPTSALQQKNRKHSAPK